MNKSPDAFRTISEVSAWLDTPAHVLRFWESRFPEIAPVKRAGGRRYYRPEDMQLLGGIKHLLHTEGHTIKSVQDRLKADGMAAVSAYSPDLDLGSDAETAALNGTASEPPEEDQEDLDTAQPETSEDPLATPPAQAAPDVAPDTQVEDEPGHPEPTTADLFDTAPEADAGASSGDDDTDAPPVGFFFDDGDDAPPPEEQSGSFSAPVLDEPEESTPEPELDPAPEEEPDSETETEQSALELPDDPEDQDLQPELPLSAAAIIREFTAADLTATQKHGLTELRHRLLQLLGSETENQS